MWVRNYILTLLDELYPHPTGRTQTEGEKELHNLHLPHWENVTERKILEN